MQRKHNFTLDILRFFAAFIVVLFHLNQVIPHVDNWYRNSIKYGWLGVPIFFVISGYFIIQSADYTRSIKDFLTRRFFRIFPAYWFSLLIVLLAAVFQKIYIGSNAVHNIPKDAISILATLTLTTSPLTKIVGMNWVYWTLTFELFFYLVIALSIIVNKKWRLGFLILVSIIALVLPTQKIGFLFFLEQWSAFGMGVSIYYYFKSSTVQSVILFLILFAINSINLILKFHFSPYTMVTLASAAIVFLSHFISIRSNIFSNLGKFSYSTYLIHVPIGVFIIGLFESAVVKGNPYLNLIYDLSVYCFICIISWLMFRYIEKPSMALGKRISVKHLKKMGPISIKQNDETPN
ncbi:peptidoglycan/LPS O-acetylase OafA/YrhL [Pedobacter sp. UYP30]|uniref:acyltransferase family protein n=1 Tax=Pedobacter sp. UYP30 TaxID=1756400 RepID=UPI0033987CF2